MKYGLVIFDLDGTILDTLSDLADAANHTLAEYGFEARSTEEIRRFIGDGAANMIRRAAPDGTRQDVLDAMLAAFKAYYADHVNLRTRPFSGVPGLLRALRDAGVHVAVNSNKPDNATRALCAAHYGSVIEMACGERDGIPRKPAPDGARHIMEAFRAEPGRTLYVGDGDADIRTAANAGIDCAWVSWGFRRREELAGLDIRHAFDTPEALLAFIMR